MPVSLQGSEDLILNWNSVLIIFIERTCDPSALASQNIRNGRKEQVKGMWLSIFARNWTITQFFVILYKLKFTHIRIWGTWYFPIHQNSIHTSLPFPLTDATLHSNEIKLIRVISHLSHMEAFCCCLLCCFQRIFTLMPKSWPTFFHIVNWSRINERTDKESNHSW